MATDSLDCCSGLCTCTPPARLSCEWSEPRQAGLLRAGQPWLSRGWVPLWTCTLLGSGSRRAQMVNEADATGRIPSGTQMAANGGLCPRSSFRGSKKRRGAASSCAGRSFGRSSPPLASRPSRRHRSSEWSSTFNAHTTPRTPSTICRAGIDISELSGTCLHDGAATNLLAQAAACRARVATSRQHSPCWEGRCNGRRASFTGLRTWHGDRPHRGRRGPSLNSALFTPEKREPRPRGIRALGPGLGLVRPAAECKLFLFWLNSCNASFTKFSKFA